MGCLTKNCGNEGANCSYLGMISQAVLEITLNQRAYDWNLENIWPFAVSMQMIPIFHPASDSPLALIEVCIERA